MLISILIKNKDKKFSIKIKNLVILWKIINFLNSQSSIHVCLVFYCQKFLFFHNTIRVEYLLLTK